MIHSRGGRVLIPEKLDHAAPEDAIRSLRDLVKINTFLGGHLVLGSLLRGLVRKSEPFSLLDVGAGSGDAGRIISKSYPHSAVISLDYRLLHVSQAAGPRVVGDALRLPFRDKSFDYAHSALFLHHFEDRLVIELIRGMRALARRAVILIDLHRTPFAYYFLPATRWLFRWHEITMHDGPVSVEASFKAAELEALAREAGLTRIRTRVHRPWQRISLVGSA